MARPISLWPDYESWEKFGIENGYEDRNSDSLRYSDDNGESSWYSRGRRKGWIRDFDFDRIRFVEWENVAEWKEFGVKNGYGERNSNSLRQSDNEGERSWYEKGVREEWIKKFNFEVAQRNNGYWRDVSNVIEQSLVAMRKNRWKELPSSRTLRENSLSSLASAINSYHGGFLVFRETLREYTVAESEEDALKSMLMKYVGGNE